jgi:hypothetical protein
MSVPEAVSVFASALAYGGWGYALAAANERDKASLTNAFIYVVFWSFIANGVVAVLVVPPPSAAFPYQDIAHFGNVIFGGLGAYACWRAMAAAPAPAHGRGLLINSAVLILAYIGQTIGYFVR